MESYPNFGTNRRYSLNYRLGGNPLSVPPDFLEQGNSMMAAAYPAGFPWRRDA